jgi:hypothetical protein
MKKASLFVALLFATSTAGLLPADALTLTTTSKVALPDDPEWNQGYSDALAFLNYEASSFGRGSAQYNADVDAEYAMAVQNASDPSNPDAMYWSGYRTGIRMKR